MPFGDMAFPGIGPSPGATALDGPPPGPTPMSVPPGGPGGGGPFSMKGLAPGGPGAIPAAGIPPEVLTGLTSAFEQVNGILDSASQITPDKSPQLALIKDMIQQYLADLMGNGAGAVSPTAAGAAPPMGGMDRGIAGPGSM